MHRQFSISSRRSLPILASQRLSGSTLGEGMDWMTRNRVSVLAQSVSRCFLDHVIDRKLPLILMKRLAYLTVFEQGRFECFLGVHVGLFSLLNS
ncbi:hypothetical protein BBC27_03415 [Acidithiobacillus ferrivorans]|uniref:Uncharacterized protein n=1 Tax=Acidithiobacillus ferrivorans TaxID=160808 RepID=A0A1B9BV42_9PROT|nr:hypothetical protein BBC27_03415 [Acidithiobacillus ferrivorans]